MEDGKRWITWKGRRFLVNDNGMITKQDYTIDKKYNVKKSIVKKEAWGSIKRFDVYNEKNEPIAFLTYKQVDNADNLFNKDKIQVGHIEVNEKYRRQGIATSLYKKLQKEAGDNDIYFGELTKDGKKLLDKIGKITKKQDLGMQKRYGEKYRHINYWGRINK